jgi:hypothetical protein
MKTSKIEFKKKQLSGQQLSLLWISLSKNLFPKPRKGEILSQSNNNGSCTLYFDKDYIVVLQTAIKEAFNSGKFKASNSEADWIDLMNAIDNVEDAIDVNIDQLETYLLMDDLF